MIENWAKVYRSMKILSCMRKGPFVIYGRDGTGFPINSGRPWIFDTIFLNHLGIQLKPALIDSLIEDSGLLLAHCYMTAHHTYIFENCFTNQKTGLSLTPSFVKNIEYISERQQAGAVISLSFAQLRSSLEAFSRSIIVRSEYGWQIDVKGGAPLAMGGSRQAIAKLECEGVKKWYQGDIGFIMLRQGSNLIKRCDRV
jgi:hypothetical protein